MKAIALTCALALSVAGCQTDARYYKALATTVGATFNTPQTEAQIKKYAARFTKYCGEIQVGATALELLAPEKAYDAIVVARKTLDNLCAAPPSDLGSALTLLVETIAVVQDARKKTGV